MTTPIDLGYSTYLNGYNSGDPIASSPANSSNEISRSDFSVAANPDQNQTTLLPEEIAEKRWIENYRGIAIQTTNDGRVFHNRCDRNYVNCVVGSSDTEVSHNVFSNPRDVNLLIKRDSGHVYTSHNHCYGGRFAGILEPTNLYTSDQDTFADALFGFYFTGWDSKFNLTTLQHNKTRDFVIQGFGCSLSDLTCYVQRETVIAERSISLAGYTLFDPTVFDRKAGIEVQGYNNRITEALIKLDTFLHNLSTPSSLPALAAVVINGDTTTLTGQIIDGDEINGSTGILFRGHHSGCVLRLDTDEASWCLPDSDVPDPTAKLIRFDQNSRMTGLDAVIRVPRAAKLSDLVDLRSDWSGRITVWNMVSGKIETLSR